MSVNWTGSGSNLLRRKSRKQLYSHRRYPPAQGTFGDGQVERLPEQEQHTLRAPGPDVVKPAVSKSGRDESSSAQADGPRQGKKLNAWLLSKPDWAGTKGTDCVDWTKNEQRTSLDQSARTIDQSTLGSIQSKPVPMVESKSHSK